MALLNKHTYRLRGPLSLASLTGTHYPTYYEGWRVPTQERCDANSRTPCSPAITGARDDLT